MLFQSGSHRCLTAWLGSAMLLSVLNVAGMAQGQATNEMQFELDFNRPTSFQTREGNLAAVARRPRTVLSQIPGYPGVGAGFGVYRYKNEAGEWQRGVLTDVRCELVQDGGVSGQPGDHALQLTVGEGSERFFASLMITHPGFELLESDPQSAIVTLDLWAPKDAGVDVRLETAYRRNPSEGMPALGVQGKTYIGTGDWQTVSFALRDAPLRRREAGSLCTPGAEARLVIMTWSRPKSIRVDNIRVQNVKIVGLNGIDRAKTKAEQAASLAAQTTAP